MIQKLNLKRKNPENLILRQKILIEFIYLIIKVFIERIARNNKMSNQIFAEKK